MITTRCAAFSRPNPVSILVAVQRPILMFPLRSKTKLRSNHEETGLTDAFSFGGGGVPFQRWYCPFVPLFTLQKHVVSDIKIFWSNYRRSPPISLSLGEAGAGLKRKQYTTTTSSLKKTNEKNEWVGGADKKELLSGKNTKNDIIHIGSASIAHDAAGGYGPPALARRVRRGHDRRGAHCEAAPRTVPAAAPAPASG